MATNQDNNEKNIIKRLTPNTKNWETQNIINIWFLWSIKHYQYHSVMNDIDKRKILKVLPIKQRL